LHNVLLIALQKPHASYVAGFRTWNQLGRFVWRMVSDRHCPPVERRVDRRLCFQVLEAESRQVEFGISLDPRYQRVGYATEALRALLNFLLIDLGKHRAIGSVDPRNLRSVKLMQRVGMRQEAHFVSSLWIKGEWVDDVIFAMLASDWREINGKEKTTSAEQARQLLISAITVFSAFELIGGPAV
jgi:RimJ/RimL family protein N-acetyltransferase